MNSTRTNYSTMMKNILPTLTSVFCSAMLLTQCSSPSEYASAAPEKTVRTPVPTKGGTVSVQNLGDTTIATRRLIQHPLTNKDIGKVYEEITMVSPYGTKMEERVIVRAAPRLETKVVTR